MKRFNLSILTCIGLSILLSCNNEAKNKMEEEIPATDTIQKQALPEFLYVTAMSGLTLREKPNLQSTKLEVMPLGSKVKIVTKEEKTTINVGGIDGGMDEVEYNNKTGFAFNGFMSRFTPPAGSNNVKNYADDLKKDFPNVVYSEASGGSASKPTKTQTLILPTDKWHEAFFMAQQLFGIPREFAFPNPTGSNVETQWAGNKKKTGQGELQISRNNNTLQKIAYRYNDGKLFHTVTITKENESMKIEKTEAFQ